jgi:hypothetical protein
VNRRRIAGPVALIIAVGLGACADTTVDTDATDPAVTDASATSVGSSGATGAPASGPDALADRLVTQARQLSDHVVEGEGEAEALAALEASWDELRPLVEDEREDLLDDFDGAMALARNAVERRRPADADKASNNLATLIAAAGLD